LPVAGIIVVLLLVALFHWFWPWYSFEETDTNRVRHHPHADIVNPIGAALGGAVLVWADFDKRGLPASAIKNRPTRIGSGV
jgi:hypothetical protein